MSFMLGQAARGSCPNQGWGLRARWLSDSGRSDSLSLDLYAAPAAPDGSDADVYQFPDPWSYGWLLFVGADSATGRGDYTSDLITSQGPDHLSWHIVPGQVLILSMLTVPGVRSASGPQTPPAFDVDGVVVAQSGLQAALAQAAIRGTPSVVWSPLGSDATRSAIAAAARASLGVEPVIAGAHAALTLTGSPTVPCPGSAPAPRSSVLPVVLGGLAALAVGALVWKVVKG